MSRRVKVFSLTIVAMLVLVPLPGALTIAGSSRTKVSGTETGHSDGQSGGPLDPAYPPLFPLNQAPLGNAAAPAFQDGGTWRNYTNGNHVNALATARARRSPRCGGSGVLGTVPAYPESSKLLSAEVVGTILRNPPN